MKCVSCGKDVKDYVEFKCLKCGEYKIIRCDSCRVLGRKYTCPKCGFAWP